MYYYNLTNHVLGTRSTLVNLNLTYSLICAYLTASCLFCEEVPVAGKSWIISTTIELPQ